MRAGDNGASQCASSQHTLFTIIYLVAYLALRPYFFWILESLSTRVTRLILNYLNSEAWILYSAIWFDHHNPVD